MQSLSLEQEIEQRTTELKQQYEQEKEAQRLAEQKWRKRLMDLDNQLCGIVVAAGVSPNTIHTRFLYIKFTSCVRCYFTVLNVVCWIDLEVKSELISLHVNDWEFAAYRLTPDPNSHLPHLTPDLLRSVLVDAIAQSKIAPVNKIGKVAPQQPLS